MTLYAKFEDLKTKLFWRRKKKGWLVSKFLFTLYNKEIYIYKHSLNVNIIFWTTCSLSECINFCSYELFIWKQVSLYNSNTDFMLAYVQKVYWSGLYGKNLYFHWLRRVIISIMAEYQITFRYVEVWLGPLYFLSFILDPFSFVVFNEVLEKWIFQLTFTSFKTWNPTNDAVILHRFITNLRKGRMFDCLVLARMLAFVWPL